MGWAGRIISDWNEINEPIPSKDCIIITGLLAQMHFEAVIGNHSEFGQAGTVVSDLSMEACPTLTRLLERRCTSAEIHQQQQQLYKCPFCGRPFSNVANQRRHMRIHTGEKPYKCQVCNRSFSQSNNLKAHLVTHKHATWTRANKSASISTEPTCFQKWEHYFQMVKSLFFNRLFAFYSKLRQYIFIYSMVALNALLKHKCSCMHRLGTTSNGKTI